MSYYTTIGPLGTDVSSDELTFGTWEKIRDTGWLTTDTTSVAFTDLNGDVDQAYFMILRIINPLTVTTAYVFLPNNTTPSGTLGVIAGSKFDGTTATEWLTGFTNLRIIGLPAGSNISGHIFFMAKTGVRREMYTVAGLYDSTPVGGSFRQGGFWNDTTTNITSIYITANQANGIGAGSRFILYRLSKL